jgi:vancomycin resistance protein YoaR
VVRLVLWAVAGLLALLLAAGVVFAGSPSRIADGVTVAGVGVGGLTADEARSKLEAVAERYRDVPVVFTAGGARWSLRPEELDARVDWSAAVAEALSRSDGPLPLRGLRRLKVRLLGTELEPRADVYEPRLQFELDALGREIGTQAREAAIVLQGLQPRVVPAEEGRRLDKGAAAATVVSALAGFDRDPVSLPVVVDVPEVTGETLAPVLAQVRTALSAPARLTYRGIGWAISPKELAPLLALPANGARELRIGGPGADRYFQNLASGVKRRPVSADFRVRGDGTVRVTPARAGRKLDVAVTSAGLLDAALRTQNRSAPLVVTAAAPEVTTAEARKLRIERRLASYTTLYSGTADRIQNLQRAVALLDGARIAPGKTFSFNGRVGPRTEERGFRVAPVIMDGKYEDGVGGGVSQVATTVFNAAWDAGLPISDRTAHALYIDRYPLGRDATVNYPDVDLRFANDTGRWLVLSAGFDESGIVISLLGAGPVRRVVSEAGELEEQGKPLVERTPDPELFVGERVVKDYGEPARAVRVSRIVYQGDEVLYRETWSTTYRSEPKLVRVGTKPVPKPAAPPKKEKPKPKGAAAPGDGSP